MSPIDTAKAYILAVQTGDQASLAQLISPNIVWHQPGTNRFSGIHRGLPAVLSMIGKMMEISQGSFAITRTNRFMANGDWVAIDLNFAAQRPGMKLDQPGVDVIRIENGQVVEVRLFSSDQDAEDAFWAR